MEWGNKQFENIDNIYAKQAYENKKWAFVSDYLRLYALRKYGGFYFDTDLELTKSIDEFRNNKFIIGWEVNLNEVHPMTAFIGATKNCSVVNDLLQTYESIEFIKNGEMNLKTNVLYFAEYFRKRYGLIKPYDKDSEIYLEDRVVIKPSYYFCTPENNKENYAIHHFNASWVDPWLRRKIFNVGKYKIVRFRKNINVKGDHKPLLTNEKIVSEFSLSSNKKYCIIEELL